MVILLHEFWPDGFCKNIQWVVSLASKFWKLNYRCHFLFPNAFCRCWLWNWCLWICWGEVGRVYHVHGFDKMEWIPRKVTLFVIIMNIVLNGWYEYSDAINNVSWSNLLCLQPFCPLSPTNTIQYPTHKSITLSSHSNLYHLSAR